MQTRNLFYLCLIWLIMLFIGLRTLCAGDVSPGATSGSINYQGRLEKDNAPLTGIVHLRFRIFNILTGGTCPDNGKNCLWESDEITVTATQGIFGASITPDLEILATAGNKYLEVQVEDQVLSPRELLRSVMYSMISKRVEDGADLVVSTLTSTYGVLLAMDSGNVGIGITPQPQNKLEVAGHIKISGVASKLYFDDGSSMSTAGVGSATGVSANTSVTIESDVVGPDAGDDIIFETTSIERMRLLTTNGNLGIGTANPSERLEINGNLANTAGNFGVRFANRFTMRPSIGNANTEGIFRVMPRNDDVEQGASIEAYLMTDALGFSADPVNYTRGRMSMTGTGLEFVADMGGTGAYLPILFRTSGSEVVRIGTNGDVGIGTGSPGAQLHVVSDGAIGIRGDNVLIGGVARANEIRSATGVDLVMQDANPMNVGIGTDNPVNKLHVDGSIRSNFGIIAATGAFSGKVSVNGNFIALSGSDRVKLSSTTIYGTLIVTGGIGGEAGLPAYVDSSNIFTAPLNTFENSVLIDGRLSAGTAGYGFMEDHLPGSNYLQVGAGDASGAESDDAIAYLASGNSANAILSFYRGDSEASRIQTSNGKNLFFVTNALTRAVITSAGYLGIGTESPSELLHVQGGGIRVSTAAGGVSIYVNPVTGNVGIGTDILATTHKLTVAGDIRLSTSTYGIIFADGSFLNTAGGGSVNSVSSNDDAIVRGDADSSGQGDVILKVGAWSGVVVKAGGGKVGIGTVNPKSMLQVRGGDVLIGDPVNTSPAGSDDLIVEGNVYVDGILTVGSLTPDMLDVTGHAFSVGVSTLVTAYGQVGIGTANPGYTLDVDGDINTSGNLMTGGTARISATGVVGSGNANAMWDGDTIAVDRGGTGVMSLTSNGVVIGNGTSGVTVTAAGTANQLLASGGASDPVWTTATYPATGGAAGTIMRSDGTNWVNTTATYPSATTVNQILYSNAANAVTGLATANNRVLVTNGAGIPSLETDIPAAVTIGGGYIYRVGGTDVPVADGGTGVNGALTGMVKGGNPMTGVLGTLNYAARWTAVDTIGIGVIQDDGTNVGIGGAPGVSKLTVNGDLIMEEMAAPAVSALNQGKIYFDSGTDLFYISEDNGAFVPLVGSGGNIGGSGTFRDIAMFAASGKNIGDSNISQDASGNVTIGSPRWLAADEFIGALTGNADTVTNGVYTTGSYADPAWITSLAGSKISGNISGNAGTVTNGVYTTGSYADPAWITSLAGSKISGNISGDAANVTGTVAVGNGGTGRATLTAGRVLLGNDANGINVVSAAGLTGTVEVTDNTGIATCTLTFTSGILTSENCPP